MELLPFHMETNREEQMSLCIPGCVCGCSRALHLCCTELDLSAALSGRLQDNDFPSLFPRGRFCHGLYLQHCARGSLMGMLNLPSRVRRGHLIHGSCLTASSDNHTHHGSKYQVPAEALGEYALQLWQSDQLMCDPCDKNPSVTTCGCSGSAAEALSLYTQPTHCTST